MDLINCIIVKWKLLDYCAVNKKEIALVVYLISERLFVLCAKVCADVLKTLER